jgi:dTDP-4-dehydrorhamnose reductase
VFSGHGHNFVKTMLRLAAEREELRVVADQHGRPTAAADLAEAMLGIAARIANGSPHWGTFHFANAGATSWHGFAQAIVEEQVPFTGKRPRVLPIATHEFPTPTRRPANSVLATTAIELAYGVSPRPWREALSLVVGELLGAPDRRAAL